MKQFTDKNSPGLFEDILNCLSGGKSLSSRRNKMQEQRVVSLLHIIAYFRSQKTSALQKDSGLYAANCGMSLQGLSAGQILGYSTTPRNVQQLKADLSKDHANYISQQLHRVNELTCFMVLMVDDFHNIHSFHTPARLVRTNVVHMASCIADVHPTVSAVTRPSSSLHRQVVITVNGQQKTCLGGIHVPSVLEMLTNALINMHNQFLDQLPQNMQSIDPGRLQAALRELRFRYSLSMNLNLAITLLAIMICRMFCQLNPGRCRSEYSISGMMLKGHIFLEEPTTNLLKCVDKCNDDVRCQSFNYVITRGICELNDRTKEARPEHFVEDRERVYLKRLRKRAPLGSIVELPAESCAEIKTSEGENAASGSYWFSSIKPGEVVLAPCNMTTEDADECNASVPVCDVNAKCINTIGSFICACKTGFSGDGFTCSDIDECASGANGCISGRATCSNTAGSYNCICNHSYTGDGKTSCLSQECQSYQNLTNGDRKNTSGAGLVTCDNSLGPGWFRFQGDAGTKMAATCVPYNHCGTHATGWLNGAHPTVAEGQVTRQVCFNWISNCCTWSINIQVQSCGDFFIYYISGTPQEHPCHLRYCGAD